MHKTPDQASIGMGETGLLDLTRKLSKRKAISFVVKKRNHISGLTFLPTA